MKAINFFPALLFPVLLATHPIQAQGTSHLTKDPPAIGKPCPDYLFKTILNSHFKTARISSFRGKYLILDFWGTWCGSCVEALPLEDSIQKQNKEKLQFLLISSETPAAIQKFFNKADKSIPLSLPSASDTSWLLAQRFKVRYVPHYVWIDKAGIIRAISGAEEVTPLNVEKFIAGDSIDLAVKVDDPRIEFDYNRPFITDSNYEKATKVIAYRILTPFVKGLLGMMSIPKTGEFANRRIFSTDGTVAGLYRIAYGEGEFYDWYPYFRTIVDVKDTLKICITSPSVWNRYKYQYGVCYDLIIPKPDSAALFAKMREDLHDVYGLKVSKEMRQMPCWVLKVINPGLLHTASGKPAEESNQFSLTLTNMPVKTLCEDIYENAGSKTVTAIVDETNYPSNIDITLNANIKDLDALNKELLKYGLRLSAEERNIQVLVLKD